MKMDEVAGSGNDEFYTPFYAVAPILKYIPTCFSVWCPFDTESSHFVQSFRGRGNRVTASHISEGRDFFDGDLIPLCDVIVSNPPYSRKGEVFKRLFELNKPFAMLVGVVGLFESQKRFNMCKDNDFQIMYLNRRVSYFRSYTDQKPSLNPPFSSVYICHGLLPKQIIFEEIQK